MPPPRRILDCGCGIGIAGCFCAKLYPEAEVVGVDCCKASIDCANQLAVKLGLQNARFHHADVLELPQAVGGQRFDRIFSTCVAHEVGGLLSKPARTIEEMTSRSVDPQLAAYAQALAGSLEDAGTLISFERTYNPILLAEWGRALHDTGVGVDWEGIHVLSFVEYHGTPALKLPVLVGSKNRSDELEPDELRAMWLQKMGQSELFGVKHDIAEAVFAALQPKRFLKGVRFKQGIDACEVRNELWQVGSLAIHYRYENSGWDLAFVPRHLIPQALHDMYPYNHPDSPPSELISFQQYSSPEEPDGELP
jgi:SAM-dependent methyltransferase